MAISIISSFSSTIRFGFLKSPISQYKKTLFPHMLDTFLITQRAEEEKVIQRAHRTGSSLSTRTRAGEEIAAEKSSLSSAADLWSNFVHCTGLPKAIRCGISATHGLFLEWHIS